MQVRLLLSTQRSGSHFLKSLIDSRFSGVVCSGEVLEEPFEHQGPVLASHPEVARFWTWYIQQAAAGFIQAGPGERLPVFESYLNEMARLTAPSDLVVDIKYNCIHSLSGYEDTDHGSTQFTEFVQRANIPVLHLIRRNILKTQVSHELARRTGIWHRTSDKSLSEILPKFHLDPARVLAVIRHAERLTEDYREHFRTYPAYEEVVYEDLVHEQDFLLSGASLHAVSRFLDRTPREFSPGSIWCRKTTPNDPAEVVENWSEIVSALRPTKFAWMALETLSAAA